MSVLNFIVNEILSKPALLVGLMSFVAIIVSFILLKLTSSFFKGTVVCSNLRYTLLSGFRLPWPPSCCLNESTPFVGSDERAFGHFNPAFGSSRIASSAYQKRPTKNLPFKDRVQSSNAALSPI